MKSRILLLCVILFVPSVYGAQGKYGVESLGDGFVRGDVVSYSYVPNKYWTLEEAIGICPYLCEYDLMAWDSDQPMENNHAENIRRIDQAAKWSTAIMFYAREPRFRDEIIRLMLHAYSYRQLFILRDYWSPGDEREAFYNTVVILSTLWDDRDKVLVSPEGDRASGRQLINNILMVKMGDEGFCSLRTGGLEIMCRAFQKWVQQRPMGGEKPFTHIKSWYNEIAWSGWNYGSCWASNEKDQREFGRSPLPANLEFFGVDNYDYWWHNIGFDPIYPANHTRVLSRVREWHKIRTQYYPEGIETCVCRNANDPLTWTASCWSDTHAVLNGIRYARADKGMMLYIGLSSSLPNEMYTTPVETMDAYYDYCKAGPWVGLIWWTAAGREHPKQYPLGTLGYIDKTLIHYTPDHPKGIPYSQEDLNRLHDQFIASRMRMFRDVVYNQFGFLNGPMPK
jgi:hypothetical protein